MVSWRVAKPVGDNASKARDLWPDMNIGTIGNKDHLYVNGLNASAGLRHGDHTPHATDSIPGDIPPWPGYVYAVDLGECTGFVPANFARWLVGQCKAGKYPEVKYVCCDWRLWDRRYQWAGQPGNDGPDHCHISFRAGYESARSTIVSDYYGHLHGGDDMWTDAEKKRVMAQLDGIDDVVRGGKGAASKGSELEENQRELQAAIAGVLAVVQKIDARLAALESVVKGA